MTRFSQPGVVRTASYSSPPEGGLFIDVNTTSLGYVTAGCLSGEYDRLKFQVRKGGMTYNYDLPRNGVPRQFPVNMGNGEYMFRIMEHVEGTKYTQRSVVIKDVTLRSQYVPFTLPTAFCEYASDGRSVRLARRVTRKCKTEGDALRAVYRWVHENLTYDNEKAKTLSSVSGYVPKPDETAKTRKGVCFDYASLMAAMLRSMGIPCKVVTGYTDERYHAWVVAHVDGRWVRCDPTFGRVSGHTYKVRFVF